jgi:hypothetical protein
MRHGRRCTGDSEYNMREIRREEGEEEKSIEIRIMFSLRHQQRPIFSTSLKLV